MADPILAKRGRNLAGSRERGQERLTHAWDGGGVVCGERVRRGRGRGRWTTWTAWTQVDGGRKGGEKGDVAWVGVRVFRR